VTYVHVEQMSANERHGWSAITCFCRKCRLVVEQVLNPGHHIVDVCWCRQVHAFPLMVNPCVAQSYVKVRATSGLGFEKQQVNIRLASRHCRTCLLRAAFRNDAIELVQVGIKVEN